MNTIADIINRMKEVNTSLDADSIYNRIAMLYAVGYNGRVVITKGNFIGSRTAVVSGRCYDVLKKLEKYPKLAATHIDPDGVVINDHYGLPATEFFVTLYDGEK